MHHTQRHIRRVFPVVRLSGNPASTWTYVMLLCIVLHIWNLTVEIGPGQTHTCHSDKGSDLRCDSILVISPGNVYIPWSGWRGLITRWWNFKYLLFSTLLGEMIQFDKHIFPLGWNHQLVVNVRFFWADISPWKVVCPSQCRVAKTDLTRVHIRHDWWWLYQWISPDCHGLPLLHGEKYAPWS